MDIDDKQPPTMAADTDVLRSGVRQTRYRLKKSSSMVYLQIRLGLLLLLACLMHSGWNLLISGLMERTWYAVG